MENLTMQQLVLYDGRELTPSESESDASDVTCQVTEDEDSKSDISFQATEDEDYYLDLVKFKVGEDDRLFRVPSYQFFKESHLFCEMYKLSAHVRSGDPIKLERVTRGEFRSLLKILYPLSLPTMKLPFLSEEEWISVLTLASRWRFLRVRAMAENALERMGSLTSLEKIRLGRGLFISSWVIDGFVELVQAITIADFEALILDSGAKTTAYKLFRIRELRIAGKLSSAKTKVEEVFKVELDRLRTKEKTFMAG